MSHQIYLNWNTLAKIDLAEESEHDYSVRLTHIVDEGPTSYRLEYETVDGDWRVAENAPILHLTGQQIVEAEEGGLLKQIMGTEETAKAIGMEKNAFAVLVQRGQFIPPATRIAATPIWLRPDVMRWKAKQKGKIEVHGEDKK